MRHSVIPYIGGKYDQAPWIVARFPIGYTKMAYVEPFAGSLSVFFYKEQSSTEIINDANADVQNLWSVIQSDGERLAEEARKVLYARAIYEGIANKWRTGYRPEAPFERAMEFYYLCRSSFSAKIRGKSGWARTVTRSHATSYRNATEEIPWAQKRLEHTTVDFGDFRRVVKVGDYENCLMYCDPPFVNCEQYYPVRFAEADHRELAELLNGSAAKVAVSYYEHPLVAELYPEERWTYHRRRQTIDADGSVRDERRNHVKRSEIELLITNYKKQPTLF